MSGPAPTLDGLEASYSSSNEVSFERLSVSLIESARNLSAATVHEASGRIGALPSSIKPLRPDWVICGTALTVHLPSGDNLWLHHAIYNAKAGDVLVAYCSGGFDFGYWGEVMATAAIVQGVSGLVIDGGVRDTERLKQLALPTFARSIAIRGTQKDPGCRGGVGAPILLADVLVKSGDLIIGDADGVVAIPKKIAGEVVTASGNRDKQEEIILKKIMDGCSTLEIYNL